MASLRAYANSQPGLHWLSVTATDSRGDTSTRQGSFEVVPIQTGQGQVAKNIIILLGDGMGASHRTAARIMAKGYLQGMAQDRLAMDKFPVTGMVMTKPQMIKDNTCHGFMRLDFEFKVGCRDNKIVVNRISHISGGR